VRIVLSTPPVARIVPDDVFDAFGWCESDTLEWRRPSSRWDTRARITSKNPARMAFVMHQTCEFLPRELAKLHVRDLGLEEQWALAPWAIDAATDDLFEHRARPRDIFWLAAESVEGLVWGLHDWAHFHSHGPFDARAWTELQCDATALAWLWINRGDIGIDEDDWDRVRREVVALSRARFAEEGQPFDESVLEASAVRDLAQVAARMIRS
jgi:hypothetical protein